jgi:hypothetical protein
MQHQHPSDGNSVRFSGAELYDYACGDLRKERTEQLEARAAVDEELAAKIRFYKWMALGITEDEDGDDETVGH